MFYKNLFDGVRKDKALRKAKLDYLDNTTFVYVNGIPTAWSDDVAPPASTTFAFDEGGTYYPNAILPGDSIEIIFTASINARPAGDGNRGART